MNLLLALTFVSLLCCHGVASSSVVQYTDGKHNVVDTRRLQTELKSQASKIAGINVTSSEKICHHVPCPPNILVQDRGTYQLRRFVPAPYAKTAVLGYDAIEASNLLYNRLLPYITGVNSRDSKLPPTAPTILRIDPSTEGPFGISNFTLFYYISPDVKRPWPEPYDRRIEVLDVRGYEIYIRTFSGYPQTQADWIAHHLQLVADLEEDGVDYVSSYYYFASYDNPFILRDRINEVQILKPRAGDL